MRKISFIVAIYGLSFLIGLLAYEAVEESNSTNGSDGKLVFVQGVVEGVRPTKYGLVLELQNISIFCRCSGVVSGDYVWIKGVIDRYKEYQDIEALSVEVE